jgi:hypothetical protein
MSQYVNNDNAYHTNLLDIHNRKAVFQEVKFIVRLINHQFDFQYLDKTFGDVDKLIPLFHEFEEGKVPGFESELDLLRKTTNFYKSDQVRFENDLSNIKRYMVSHFQDRWNIERNIYGESIEKNINYLKYILKSKYKNLHDCLRRNAITLQ